MIRRQAADSDLEPRSCPHGFDGRGKEPHALGLRPRRVGCRAQVDCTAPVSESLCIKHRIDAFPTILVFRKDDTVLLWPWRAVYIRRLITRGHKCIHFLNFERMRAAAEGGWMARTRKVQA